MIDANFIHFIFTSNCLPDSFDANKVRSISNLQRFPKSFDANRVRLISNLKLSPRQFELCGGGSSKGLGDLFEVGDIS